jgi:hypothetical protein
MGKTLHPLVPYCALRLGGKIRMEWWQKSFCFFNAGNASSNSGSSPGKWALEIAFLVQREIKRCAFSDFTFGPRIATVPSYNSRHRCESDTVAGKLLRGVKPLEQAIGGARIKSDSVIASSRTNIDRNSVFKGLHPEFNSCAGTAGRIFPGIAKRDCRWPLEEDEDRPLRGRSAITNSTVRSGASPQFLAIERASRSSRHVLSSLPRGSGEKGSALRCAFA